MPMRTLAMPTLAYSAALALLLAGAACGGGDSLTFAQKAELEDIEQAAQLDIFCNCYADFAVPFASKAACVEGLTIAPNVAVEQCRIDAYELAPESSHEHLDCRLQVLEDATTCLDANYSCADTTTFAQCDAQRVEALTLCPPLATIVVDAHIACAQ